MCWKQQPCSHYESCWQQLFCLSDYSKISVLITFSNLKQLFRPFGSELMPAGNIERNICVVCTVIDVVVLSLFFSAGVCVLPAGYSLLPQVMAGFYQPMLQPVPMTTVSQPAFSPRCSPGSFAVTPMTGMQQKSVSAMPFIYLCQVLSWCQFFTYAMHINCSHSLKEFMVWNIKRCFCHYFI